jgi:hypothetical protein
VHEVALHSQAVPAVLHLGVRPLHPLAQQTPLVPVVSVTQWPLAQCASEPTVQLAPFCFLSRQVPVALSHHFPVPQAASLGQEPQLVMLTQ